MSRVNERFIRVFEGLSELVNARAGRPRSHAFELDAACNRNKGIQKYRSVLQYMRDVRNTLQHPRHKASGPAVLVSEPFVAELETLLQKLSRSSTAKDVGVAKKDIRVGRPEETLGSLADLMREKGFSHLPILGQSDEVVGVFNEASVFAHLWREGETIVGRDMRLSDIMEDCLIESSRTETFQFVRPGTPLRELQSIFLSLHTPFSRVGAVFVTASGRQHEPLQRLITPWDILALENDAKGGGK